MIPFSISTECATNFQYAVQKPLNWLLVVQSQMEGEPSTADEHKQQQPKASAAATKESTSRLPHSLVNAAATTVAALNSTGFYNATPALLPVWQSLALALNERRKRQNNRKETAINEYQEQLLEHTRKQKKAMKQEPCIAKGCMLVASLLAEGEAAMLARGV